MENNHIKVLELKGFKKFNQIKIDEIGQFNLIIGDNNVGKTSLLEALLIDYDRNKSITSLSNILFHVRKFTYLNHSLLNYFVSDDQKEFPKKIWVRQNEQDSNFNEIKYESADDQSYSAISKRNGEIFDSLPDDRINFENNSESQAFNFNVPFIPFGSLYNHELTKLYSNNIQLYVDKKEQLVESLSHLIKNIKNIEVNTSYSNYPIILISEKGKNKLSPLAAYGDGTVKLFRILLSLFSNNHYNRLMIDELDAGVHYSKLTDFIKSLFKIAQEQKKQIFATSHSKECIESFTQALEELGIEQDGRIIRLANTAKGIKAFTMKYAEFENALEAESEIR